MRVLYNDAEGGELQRGVCKLQAATAVLSIVQLEASRRGAPAHLRAPPSAADEACATKDAESSIRVV